MKKYLLMFFFLCLTVPGTADAESYLNTNDSFQTAKAVKLGRSTSRASGRLSTPKARSASITKERRTTPAQPAIVKSETSRTLKSCGPDCRLCDTATGACQACYDESAVLTDGKCESSAASNETSGE